MERYPNSQLLELLSSQPTLDRLKAALQDARRRESIEASEPSPLEDTRAEPNSLDEVVHLLRQVADDAEQSTRDVATYARTEAQKLVDQIVPGGTRPNDDITLPRQTFENAIARAIVAGYELGTRGR